jgi:hypothetical protein
MRILRQEVTGRRSYPWVQVRTIDIYNEAFIPAGDSAWTIICQSCGELEYKFIYAKLGNMIRKPVHPSLYKTFTQTRYPPYPTSNTY